MRVAIEFRGHYYEMVQSSGRGNCYKCDMPCEDFNKNLNVRKKEIARMHSSCNIIAVTVGLDNYEWRKVK